MMEAKSTSDFKEELMERISRLRTQTNEPVDFIYLSNLPGQVLLSEKMREELQIDPKSPELRRIGDFLEFLQEEKKVEEEENERREKVYNEVSALFDDIKNHLSKMLARCSRVFFQQNPLLQKRPILDFLTSYSEGLMSNDEELELNLRSMTLLLHHKLTAGGHFMDLPVAKLKELMDESKQTIERSLKNLNRVVLEQAKSTGTKEDQISMEFKEGTESPGRVSSLEGKEQRKEMQLEYLMKVPKIPGPVCGKGKGIVCTQNQVNRLYYALGSEGSLLCFKESGGDFEEVFTKKIEVGKEDWSHSISLNPSESYLAVGAVNLNTIYVLDLKGEIIQKIESKINKESTWMFTCCWVSDSLLGAGFADGRVQIFQLGVEMPIKELRPFHGRCFSLVVDEESKYLYCGSTTGHIAMISVEKKEVRRIERVLTSWIHTMALNEEGTMLACGGDGKEVLVLGIPKMDTATVVQENTNGEIHSLIWATIKGFKLSKARGPTPQLFIVTENSVTIMRHVPTGLFGFGERVWNKALEINRPGSSLIHSGIIVKKASVLIVGDEEGCLSKLELKGICSF